MVPFAMLEPVQVGGVTVSKATLHNEEDIARKDIREGDQVVVMRAGDVIPQVVSPVTQRRDGKERPYVPPKKCPACGTKTVKPEGEVWTRCPNRNDCPGQIAAGAQALHVEGRDGHRGLRREARLPLLRRGARALAARRSTTLTVERLEPLEGFQRKSAENLVDAIERSKQQPFHRVLYALGIPGIGYVNARALAAHFGSIDRLMKPTQEEIEEVEGIGPVLAGTIRETLAEPRNRELIERAARGRAATGAGARRRRRRARRSRARPSSSPGTLEGMTPRAGDRADRGARREGDRLGLRQDRLRRRRRRPRDRSSTRRATSSGPVIDEAELEQLLRLEPSTVYRLAPVGGQRRGDPVLVARCGGRRSRRSSGARTRTVRFARERQ